MNRTPLLTLYSQTSPEQESLEAQKFFPRIYPSIKYIAETDSFEYRGVIFDYFKCGHLFIRDRNSHEFSGSYLLVDPKNSRNWLFTYGDAEDRWKDFINYKKGVKKLMKPKKSLWRRIFNI